MKIAIIDFQYRTEEYFTQESAGSYGLKTKMGDSVFAKLITKYKKQIKLPVIMLAYIAAILDNNGHEVIVINDESEIVNADLYLMHSSIVNFGKEIQLSRLIKEKTGAKIGIIGPFSTYKPEIFLDDFNFVVQGEPENAIRQIKDAGSIPSGIVQSPRVENLDELPFPAWKFFKISKYSHGRGFKQPFLSISGSRGCSASCNYCSYRAYYGNYRGRTVESVINEIAYLKKDFKIKSIVFRDSNFTFNKEWAIELAEEMIRRKFNIEWLIEARLDFLDTDLIKLFKRAGLIHIGIGVEGANEDFLKKSSRLPIKKAHQEKIIRYCNDNNVSLVANYLFGLPGDTRENILNTIQYAKKLNTRIAAFCICTPYPGTTFYEKIKDRIYEKDFEKYTTTNPIFEIDGLSGEELLRLLEKAYVSYYFRPAWLLKHAWRFL